MSGVTSYLLPQMGLEAALVSSILCNPWCNSKGNGPHLCIYAPFFFAIPVCLMRPHTMIHDPMQYILYCTLHNAALPLVTVEPVNPDSGRSRHLHLTDIKLLSRIFLHFKLIFRHLKNPDTSVFRNQDSHLQSRYIISSYNCLHIPDSAI